MTRDQISGAYQSRYNDILLDIAKNLDSYVRSLVDDAPRVDRISIRAKSPDRFLDKALKLNDDDSPKYSDPLNEIQDQIGGRITVFYLADVARLKQTVLQYFTPIEMIRKEPVNSSAFGYFGEHFILKIPDDVIPEGSSDHPEFFELQIKTLFQHAWSEADHDLAYKSIRALDPIEQRDIAFSAAQAWGADRIFQELATKLVSGMSQ